VKYLRHRPKLIFLDPLARQSINFGASIP
jgi:hypothetical protein